MSSERRAPSARLLLVLVTALAAVWAPAQTLVLFEDFESGFPTVNGWTVANTDPTGPAAYWGAVPSGFGTVGAPRFGLWMGYCAGPGFHGTPEDPTFPASLLSSMWRAIDLSGFAGAELSFWYHIPSMLDYFETLRVSVDDAVIFSRDHGVNQWSEVRLNLTPFVNGVHRLKFEFAGRSDDLFEGAYLDAIRVVGCTQAQNDALEGAVALTGAAGFVNGFNVSATRQIGEPGHAGNSGGHSVWYRWTAPSGLLVSFDTGGSTFDTLLAVYVGERVDVLTPVASNHDIYAPRNLDSRVRFTPVPGIPYLIAVDGAGGQTGAIRLTWRQSEPPDLIVWGPAAEPRISMETFVDSECCVVEGLVQAGTRKLVTFDTETRNIGTADLLLGESAGNPLFAPGACHPHNHLLAYLAHRVRDSAGHVVVLGNKVGFCLEDTDRWSPTAASNILYECSYQGLQAGWADVYPRGLPGQWVDVTALPAGNYLLDLEVNPDHVLEETDYGNNLVQVPFSIPPYDNDLFVNATRISDAMNTLEGTNITATTEPGEPLHAGVGGGHSVWYCWTPAVSAPVRFDTPGSTFNTLLAVYTGNSVTSLVQVVANDDIDPSTNEASRVTFNPTAGLTYWIAVDGADGAVGVFTLHRTYTLRLSGTNDPAGRFIVTIDGLPGHNYAVESSDDFVGWTQETVVTSDLAGRANYDSGSVTTRLRRFFRASPVSP